VPAPLQLDLFGAPEEPHPSLAPEAVALAARLPEGLRLGTCSWSFPGWEGLVFARGRRPRSVRDLARDGLAEYARHPLLRTVEIDRSFYAPLPEDDLRRYANQLPAGYPCCLKAPASVTSLVLPHAPLDAGPPRPNPDYLSVARLHADLLDACARVFAEHVGPIVLEFPRAPRALRPTPAAFARDLGRFLAELPRGFHWAVELRDRRLLTPAYAETLALHGVAHAYTYWSDMPSPAEQARQVPVEPAPFLLLRLLLKPGRRYEDERERFAPFDRVVEPDADLRAQVAALARGALARGQPSWVLANNKAEGSAPLTLFALAEMLAQPD
jgi:uncharacterized protein YecE (DUF72 family)